MFDIYSLKARVYPLALVFLPVFGLGLFYSIEFNSILHSLTSIGLMGALSFMLSQLGRDAGVKKQAALWKEWGGAPTVQLLRWQNSKIDWHTKTRYHKKLQLICPVTQEATQAFEQSNSADADVMYESWTKYLITKTRDTEKYNLLFKDNVSYGFRRNLWGLKQFAIILLVVLLVTNYLYWGFKYNSFAPQTLPVNVLYMEAVLLVFILFWTFKITKSWVRIPSESYAERLLETIDQF
jgi:hypothetical protein